MVATSFVLKTTTCLSVPQAVHTIRSRLKCLSSLVPHGALDVLAKIMHDQVDVAEAFLRDLESNCDLEGNCDAASCGVLAYGAGAGLSVDGVKLHEEHVMNGCHHNSDVYIMIDMLSIPGLLVEISQAFEKSILRGAISLQVLATVLERRHRLKFKSRSLDDSQNQDKVLDCKTDTCSVHEYDFNMVIALGEVLSMSSNSCIHDFVRMLYAIMFKIFPEEHYRLRMLKAFVDRSMNPSDIIRLVGIDMDVLVFLVRDEDGVARPVLSMMREVSELAQVDRTALWHQVYAIEDENMRLQEKVQSESSNFAKERARLTQRLSESEATVNHLKAELKSEEGRYSREKKDLSEQIILAESQLEWIRSEKDEKIAKLTAERRVLQDRLHDVETRNTAFTVEISKTR